MRELCLSQRPCWAYGSRVSITAGGLGEQGRELPPSHPGPGWTWGEGGAWCWEAWPGASCPGGGGTKFKFLAVPGQALCSPAGPSSSRPCPHHPPLITQGTIVAAANSGPELSTAKQVNPRRDEGKHSKKGSSRPKARAFSGIKSPCAGVMQAFTKAVTINPSSPICKKGLGPPYVCRGTVDKAPPCPRSPSVESS